MHKKHTEEVEAYIDHEEDLDKGKFNIKMKKAIFELKTESTELKKTPREIEDEIKKVKVFIDRE
jgi:hypothetical protein